MDCDRHWKAMSEAEGQEHGESVELKTGVNSMTAQPRKAQNDGVLI